MCSVLGNNWGQMPDMNSVSEQQVISDVNAVFNKLVRSVFLEAELLKLLIEDILLMYQSLSWL